MAARVDYLSFLFFRVPDPSLLAGEARELRLLGQEEIANVRESDLCFQSGSTRKARLRKGSKKNEEEKTRFSSLVVRSTLSFFLSAFQPLLLLLSPARKQLLRLCVRGDGLGGLLAGEGRAG